MWGQQKLTESLFEQFREFESINDIYDFKNDIIFIMSGGNDFIGYNNLVDVDIMIEDTDGLIKGFRDMGFVNIVVGNIGNLNVSPISYHKFTKEAIFKKDIIETSRLFNTQLELLINNINSKHNSNVKLFNFYNFVNEVSKG